MPTKEEIEAAAREEAESTKFEERFNAMFHKASTDREKRFKKDLLKDLDTSMSTKLDELKELIAAGAKPPGDPPKPGDPKPGDPGHGGAKLSAEAEALIRQAQKDATEAKTMAEKWKKDAEMEKSRGRAAEERQQLTTMLTGKVKPSMLEMVVDQMHSKNVIRDEETQAILWKGADGETLPLKDGVATWAKSDIGKEFAPPLDRKGNGSRSPGEGAGSVKPGEMTMDILGGIIEGSMVGR